MGEKNHRVAKAFVRSPVLTVNGGEVGFDGEVVGLAGFDNTLRDSDTESVINIVALDLLRSRLDSINKVTLAGDDEIIGTTRDKQKCKGEKDSDSYFSGLKARVPPFVIQENDLQHQQVLGHPVSWHRKVAPCPPVRKCSKQLYNDNKFNLGH